eukprot:scaffold16432_cov163-Cylindrotheca_fusiformis.AAC.1
MASTTPQVDIACFVFFANINSLDICAVHIHHIDVLLNAASGGGLAIIHTGDIESLVSLQEGAVNLGATSLPNDSLP